MKTQLLMSPALAPGRDLQPGEFRALVEKAGKVAGGVVKFNSTELHFSLSHSDPESVLASLGVNHKKSDSIRNELQFHPKNGLSGDLFSKFPILFVLAENGFVQSGYIDSILQGLLTQPTYTSYLSKFLGRDAQKQGPVFNACKAMGVDELPLELFVNRRAIPSIAVCDSFALEVRANANGWLKEGKVDLAPIVSAYNKVDPILREYHKPIDPDRFSDFSALATRLLGSNSELRESLSIVASEADSKLQIQIVHANDLRLAGARFSQ